MICKTIPIDIVNQIFLALTVSKVKNSIKTQGALNNFKIISGHSPDLGLSNHVRKGAK